MTAHAIIYCYDIIVMIPSRHRTDLDTTLPHSSQTLTGARVSVPHLHVPRSPRIYQFIFDALGFVVSFAVYYAIRFLSGVFETSVSAFTQPFAQAESSVFLAFATLGLFGYWVIIFWLGGLYADWYVRSPFDEFFTVLRVTFVGCCVLGVVIFLDDLGNAANTRLLVLFYWIAFFCSIATGRIIARAVQRSLRKQGHISFRVLLFGCANNIASLVDSLQHAPEFGFQPIGVVLSEQHELNIWNNEYQTRTNTEGLKMLGVFAESASILNRVNPDSVIVTIETPNHEELLRLANECEARHITMKIVPDLYEIFSGQTRTQHIYGISLIEISAQIMTPWQKVLKRLIDIVLSASVLILGMPLWLLIGAIVALETPGGMIFRHPRIGRHNVPFTMYKFRSMFSGSEKQIGFTKVNDARVTRFGRFIRKTHLDEIPQLWNILKGDMSLVGPRPEMPVMVERFSAAIPYYTRRHKVRPGLTGWWQVSHNYFQYQESIEAIRERLVYDFYYIENLSFRLDLEIIARTVVRVFKGHGRA
jgi:exopolysaccharide biosynthesis polyprenyl glycosylphosphotransferase